MVLIKQAKHKWGRWVPIKYQKNIEYFQLRSTCDCKLGVDHDDPEPDTTGQTPGIQPDGLVQF